MTTTYRSQSVGSRRPEWLIVLGITVAITVPVIGVGAASILLNLGDWGWAMTALLTSAVAPLLLILVRLLAEPASTEPSGSFEDVGLVPDLDGSEMVPLAPRSHRAPVEPLASRLRSTFTRAA